MKQFYVFFVMVAAASATSESDGLITSTLKFVKDCNDKSLTLCIKVSVARNNVLTIDFEWIYVELPVEHKKIRDH